MAMDLHEEKLMPTMCLYERGVESDAGTTAYEPDMQHQPLHCSVRACDVQDRVKMAGKMDLWYA